MGSVMVMGEGTATVTITVTGADHPPVAPDDYTADNNAVLNQMRRWGVG